MPDTEIECHTLYDGWAVKYWKVSAGKRQILSFVLPGDSIGYPENVDAGPQCEVQSLTDVYYCTFSQHAIDEQFRKRAEGLQVIEQILIADLSWVQDMLADLGQRTGMERMAALILRLHARLKARRLVEGDLMPFPLKQGVLADALGLTQVHVSRVLAQLRLRELVSLESRYLRIVDWQGLVQIAKFTDVDLKRAANSWF